VNCKRLIVRLKDYFDEDFDPGLRAEIEKHLADCEDCRVVVDTTRKTIEIYCRAEALPLPEETREKLHQALVEKLRRPHA
jgi:anti-sigma factor RsiW